MAYDKPQEFIDKLQTSRMNLYDIMSENGYDVTPYTVVSKDTMYAMFKTKEMDMTMIKYKPNTKLPESKIYIHYFTENSLAPKLHEIVDRYFIYDIDGETTLNSKTDTLFIVTMDEAVAVSDAVKNAIQMVWNQPEKIHIVAVTIKALQFNILKHSLVPKHRVMSQEEVEKTLGRYRPSEFPSLSRFDPVACAICAKPGQIIHIKRPSETAICADYYRLCTTD
jgi:DNA-directed RNA polymerase subunit H